MMYGQPLRLPQSRSAITHGVHGATARVARTLGAYFKNALLIISRSLVIISVMPLA